MHWFSTKVIQGSLVMNIRLIAFGILASAASFPSVALADMELGCEDGEVLITDGVVVDCLVIEPGDQNGPDYSEAASNGECEIARIRCNTKAYRIWKACTVVHPIEKCNSERKAREIKCYDDYVACIKRTATSE